MRINRRGFLRVLGAAGVAGITGSAVRTADGRRSAAVGAGGIVVYRRSGRGRHVSNAAKAHNANRLYASFRLALSDKPHPGDKSIVVSMVISAALYKALFTNFRRLMVDLRRDLHTLADFRALQACLGGPATGLTEGCTSADLTRNGTADLRDVAAFQRLFTGS